MASRNQKINKEIRDYTEDVALGLTLKQAFVSGIGVVIGGIIWFALSDVMSTDMASLFACLGVVPFGVLAFARWHKMPAEKVIKIYYMDTIRSPMQLPYKMENRMKILYAEQLENAKKEEYNNAQDLH